LLHYLSADIAIPTYKIKLNFLNGKKMDKQKEKEDNRTGIPLEVKEEFLYLCFVKIPLYKPENIQWIKICFSVHRTKVLLELFKLQAH